MDGMKLGVLDERLARADTVIYLNLSTAACLGGIARRRIRYRSRLRADLGVYDRINWKFLRWVWTFRRLQRPVLLGKLAAFGGQAFVVRRRRDARRLLDSIAPLEHRAVAA